MKKRSTILLVAVAISTLLSCKNSNKTSNTGNTDSSGSFTFAVEEDHGMTGLPGLQSFALGITNDGKWLLLSGRANGFHGFDSTSQNFPFKKANQYIFAYDTKTHKLDSMSTNILPPDLRDQYNATNLEVRQIGDKLYLCGGYGVINAGTSNEKWVTHPILSRIIISKMISAVQAHDPAAMRKAIVYTKNDLLRATGGELYKLSDNKFYLVVGHKFMGKYTHDTSTSGAPVQYYLDEVRVFTINETDTNIALGQFLQKITDGYPDSLTQYHRRDLVVAPSVLPGGKDYGITIYGGVFTYNTNVPFQFPIYITGGTTPTGKVDSGFYQKTNIYSAPNLQMYDKANDIIYTSIFGGLGDTLDTTAGNFTKLIATMAKNNKTKTTKAIYNATGMPAFVGAEGIFIRAADAPVYNNNPHDIIDFDAINADGHKHLLGYIYGGIHSNDTVWSDPQNITFASNKVYRVYISKK